MTQRVIVDADTGRNMFPNGFGPDEPGPHFPPSVVWLVREEPLVCETCKGFPGPTQFPCNGCVRGTPHAVQIVSEPECPSIDHGRNWARYRYCGTCGAGTHDEDPVTVHGVVTLGDAIPIVERSSLRNESCPCISINVTGTTRHWSDPNHSADVTDQFGAQSVTPGSLAYPIEGA